MRATRVAPSSAVLPAHARRSRRKAPRRVAMPASAADAPAGANSNPSVWYASFGSNILSERFACYLEGGRIEGMIRDMPGSRDPSPPTEWRRWDDLVGVIKNILRFHVPMFFIFISFVWSWGRDSLSCGLSCESAGVEMDISVATYSESSLARPRQTPPARRCARISAPRPRGSPSRVACGAPSRPRRAEAGREAAVPPESIRETPPPGARARAASVVRSRGPRTARRALLRGGQPSGTTRRSSRAFPAETRARHRRNDASP